MTAEIPRLLPDRPLPPYSYVSGMFPHPLRDPQGHSFGDAPSHAKPPADDNWRDCDEYLRGIDLFNHGYYWEAHEAWEAVWNAVGRTGTTADFLKGLIKLAAALVKAREGRRQGVVRHAARAEELFQAVRDAGPAAHFLGLRFAELLAYARQLQLNADQLLDTRPEAVVRLVDLRLQPITEKQDA
jgi:predicted metal-dependent hydrolase